jgi:hypothetical protein
VRSRKFAWRVDCRLTHRPSLVSEREGSTGTGDGFACDLYQGGNRIFYNLEVLSSQRCFLLGLPADG